MAHIVILGAGLGGMPMAYEMKEQLRSGDTLTVVGNGPNFHFVPSNPWVAVNWRKRSEIEFPAATYLAKKGIAFNPAGAKRVHPEKNQVELGDGTLLDYDYLIIATGPKLAFDEIEGLGPERHTQSVCHVDHAERAALAWDAFVKEPGPIVVGAVQGASCFGPAYEFAFIMETRPAPTARPRPRPDDTSSPPSPISATSDWAASATRRRCSSRRCASDTSSGSAMPRSSRSRRGACS